MPSEHAELVDKVCFAVGIFFLKVLNCIFSSNVYMCNYTSCIIKVFFEENKQPNFTVKHGSTIRFKDDGQIKWQLLGGMF